MNLTTVQPEATTSSEHIDQTERYAAHNYHPLPVVLASGRGAWVTDVDGRDFLDCLAGYSALNFGHCHPRLVERAKAQLDNLTLTSRAFYNDQLGPFVQELATLTGKSTVLPMNTGAEAVETAVKVSRKWGYRVKGVAPGEAIILTMSGNFHGRTTTIVSFSDDDVATAEYGPFTPGFVQVPYGDIAAIDAAITDSVVAVLFEPIQGEAGVLIPPSGFLRELRDLCTRKQVLMVADEVQSGLARTGRTFACDHEDVVPDIYILGKALGGGVVPVSAIAADTDILGVIEPGTHGSTFGGNPLAAAVGHEVIQMLQTGEFQSRAAMLGEYLDSRLRKLIGGGVVAVRSRGLWLGVDIDPGLMTGRQVCEKLMEKGILAKDTHRSTVRFAPPIVVTEQELDILVDALTEVLAEAQGNL